jgi:3-oxoacyl-[acyl-carrier protein] reductase
VKSVFTPGILQNIDLALWRNHHFGLPQARWDRLDGKSFWITGAGTGYGRCISLALAAAGAQVFISGRGTEKLHATMVEGTSLGIDVSRCVPVPVDITLESDLARATESIRQLTPHLFGLVNSAALPQPQVGPYPLANQSAAAWTDLMATNVTGPWLTSKVAMPLMDKGDGFRVVFLTSEAGWAATPSFGPYNVSKSAVNTLGASLAAECAMRYPGKDVQINVLVPGEARTEMNQGSTQCPYSVVSMALALLSHPPGGPNGCFFHRDGRHLSFAYSKEHPEKLLPG